MIIQVNNKQAEQIANALELQSRILAGQFEEIIHLFYNKDFDRDSVEYCLKQLKILLFPELYWREIYPIGSKKLDDRAKNCYDIYKTIQHELHKNDDTWSIHKDKPILCNEENGIKIIEEDV